MESRESKFLIQPALLDAEGALLGQFRPPTDIYGNQGSSLSKMYIS